MELLPIIDSKNWSDSDYTTVDYSLEAELQII